jgi:hypothetical protein
MDEPLKGAGMGFTKTFIYDRNSPKEIILPCVTDSQKLFSAPLRNAAFFAPENLFVPDIMISAW